MSLTRVGGDLLKQPLNIGTGVTITPDGNASFSGIVTAANLVGSDGKPIASGAGLGTAVVSGSDEGGEQIYYTNTVLNITDNLTIDPPDSANASYTQYQEVAVEQGKDLIVEDDFIVDVLGISSSVATPLPGQGGRVRADRFTNKAGTGAPEFPNGVTISAGSTVTGDFGVSDNLLVGSDLTVSGSKTYLNTNSVEFKDKNIGIASVSTGKLTDGQLNGAGFTIYGLNGDKSLTWDNPNDRMAFSTDLYAPNVTADGSITVGDTFLKPKSIGIGTISTIERNAGINTAQGELIYNLTSGAIEGYASDEDGWVNVSTLRQDKGITATGGITNDYTDPTGNTYRAHIFTSSGTFTVTDSTSSTLGNNVEYLVVAGGGGGSASNGISGGAGAGGLRTNVPGVVDAGSNSLTGAVFSAPQTGGDGSGNYTVTVGGGGVAGNATDAYTGGQGSDSYFGPPSTPNGISASGGGAGRNNSYTPYQSAPGGSGAGACGNNTGIAGLGNAGGYTPPEGNPGGGNVASARYGSGGGGGAGAPGGDAAGNPGTSDYGGAGGNGVQVLIAGPATTGSPVGTPGPTPGDGWFAGGGGGGGYALDPDNAGGVPGATAGGAGGGGRSFPTNGPQHGEDGVMNTGGGGGAARSSAPQTGAGGAGGSGIVVLRYRIGSGEAASAKATGGNIYINGDKTIHVFRTSGTFAITDTSLTSVDFLAVGGGGGGGANHGSDGGAGGGGGGAVQYRTSSPVGGNLSVVVGAAGQSSAYFASHGTQGGNSSFNSITAPGGGGGGSTRDPGAMPSGGSGGGAASDGSSPGGPQGGQGATGHPGAVDVVSTDPNGWGSNGGSNASGSQGSGGGGASANGSPVPNTTAAGGPGGDGARYTISGSTLYYGGGGGGGVFAGNANPAGSGGQGGGGNGGKNSTGTAGAPGTGGGGGGGGMTPGTPKGGSPGGSGIVIISYPT